jgi:hypothetical protein
MNELEKNLVLYEMYESQGNLHGFVKIQMEREHLMPVMQNSNGVEMEK